jgi:hypothetical protein
MLSGVEAGLFKGVKAIRENGSSAFCGDRARVMISERHQRCADSIGCYGG